MKYTEVTEWRWPNFTPKEIACKSTGEIVVDEDALDKLQALRDNMGVPLVINSAYRSPSHNKAVGGGKNSMHLTGKAFDIRLTDKFDKMDLLTAARDVGFTGFGFYSTFLHVDTGRSRWWGEKWQR